MTTQNETDDGPDLGDLVIVLLASTLAGLRDRLESDGFISAARCVSDTVEIADRYLERGRTTAGTSASGSA